jgi:hypothetical protein
VLARSVQMKRGGTAEDIAPAALVGLSLLLD